MKKVGIIIPAGGTGSRMGGSETAGATPKQFMPLEGKPVLARVIEIFRRVVPHADIVVALPAHHKEEWARLCAEHKVPAHKTCTGGATRFASVRSAMGELSPDCEYIAVHDAARPLVSGELVLRTIDTAREHGSAIPVVPLTDSIRRITENGSYPEERSQFRGVQTPQVFRADILRTAYERASGEDFGDDAAVVESMGYTVVLCRGERRNIKITEPDDMTVAGALIKNRL